MVTVVASARPECGSGNVTWRPESGQGGRIYGQSKELLGRGNSLGRSEAYHFRGLPPCGNLAVRSTESMSGPKLIERAKKSFGVEYAQFFLIAVGLVPRICPNCRQDTFRQLWVGDPTSDCGDSIWAKWYLWCESCLQGIYCPPGSYCAQFCATPIESRII